MTERCPPLESHSPSWLVFGGLNDERHRFSRYWPRLKEVDVPTPTTAIIPLRDDPDHEQAIDSIHSTMEQWDVQRAMLRGEYKAAPNHLERGSFIRQRERTHIDRTVKSLLDQLDNSPWDHGGQLVLREWLDVHFCLNAHDSCHPELRYFIEDGDILGRTPDPAATDWVCPNVYEHLEETLTNLDTDTPHCYAQRVADEFTDLPRTVDVVLTTGGEWYVTELHLNAIRQTGDGQWKNLCGHGQHIPYSPEVVHEPSFLTR